jgi:hypothetical protein
MRIRLGIAGWRCSRIGRPARSASRSSPEDHAGSGCRSCVAARRGRNRCGRSAHQSSLAGRGGPGRTVSRSHLVPGSSCRRGRAGRRWRCKRSVRACRRARKVGEVAGAGCSTGGSTPLGRRAGRRPPSCRRIHTCAWGVSSTRGRVNRRRAGVLPGTGRGRTRGMLRRPGDPSGSRGCRSRLRAAWPRSSSRWRRSGRRFPSVNAHRRCRRSAPRAAAAEGRGGSCRSVRSPDGPPGGRRHAARGSAAAAPAGSGYPPR